MEEGTKKPSASGLGDYQLASLGWSENASDLLLRLIPPGAQGRLLHLRFVCAVELRMEIYFGGYSGRPLIYGAEIVTNTDLTYHRVKISSGAAPEGLLSFGCSDVEATWMDRAASAP